jgi:hypothetical protein
MPLHQCPVQLASDRRGRDKVDLRSVESGKCDIQAWVRGDNTGRDRWLIGLGNGKRATGNGQHGPTSC